MKIINASRPCFDDRLIQEIRNLESRIGLSRHNPEDMPKNIQRDYLKSLQDFVEFYFADYRVDNSKEEAGLTEPRVNSSFSKFSSLPCELRLKIFEFSFASDLEPKVHCVNECMSKSTSRRSSFMSNQPISPLLHVCRESRAHYFFKTRAQFAFETFIRFSVDTIYIPDFFSREIQFPRFLKCESVRRIQKLAMRKDFFCDIPGSEHFCEKHVDMLYALPRWREMIIVFNDYGSCKEVWENRDLSFRDLSAKEKRSGPGSCERGYARQWSFHLNDFSSKNGFRKTRFRYVVPRT